MQKLGNIHQKKVKKKIRNQIYCFTVRLWQAFKKQKIRRERKYY